jgi:hypothetical protein
MTKPDIELILHDIAYKDWQFYIGEKDGVLFLQVRLFRLSEPGKLQHGRKWLLSEHMVKSEIVQTAFKAVLTAEEHECREQFRYRGEPIFGAHYDVEALHELARAGRFEVRK